MSRITTKRLEDYAEHMTAILQEYGVIDSSTYVYLYKFNDLKDYRLKSTKNSDLTDFLVAGRDGTNKELWIQAQNFMAGVSAMYQRERWPIDKSYRESK